MAMMSGAELPSLAFVGAVVDDVVDGELPHASLLSRSLRSRHAHDPGDAPRGRGQEPNSLLQR